MTMPVPPGLAPDLPAAPPEKPPPFRVDAPQGSPLDELLAQRAEAKARLDEAEQIYDALDTRVKGLLARLLPARTIEIEVPGTAFRKGIRFAVRRKRTFKADRLRADHPEIDYAPYWEWGKPYFEISKL